MLKNLNIHFEILLKIKKNCANYNILHIFEKPLTQQIQKHLQNSKTYMCNQEKLKMCKFPVKASVQKSVQNFFAKSVQSVCFCYRLPKRYKMLKSKNWK